MAKFYKRYRDRITGLFFVLPAVLYMMIMMIYPLVYNFILSFRDLNVMTFKGNTSVFVGFSKLCNDFAGPGFYTGLLANVVVYLRVYCSAVYAGHCAGRRSSMENSHWPDRCVVLLLVAWMMPVAVTGLLFKYMFLTEGGVINTLLHMFGLMRGEPLGWLIDPKLAMWAVIIANCWVGVPFNMLLLATGMSNIPPDVYESAAIDGCNVIQRFFRITIPLLKTSILSVLMLGFIYTFKVFDLIFMMTKGGPLNATEVLSTYSYRQSFSLFNFSMGSASAVLLFVCLMMVGVFYLRLIRKDEVM